MVAKTGRKIIKIVSGGQTGVDRAALDTAIAQGLDYGGWCPKGGWAEDQPDPPGLLTNYPRLLETPAAQPAQRTEWNVRASSATLILFCDQTLQQSAGTKLTYDIAKNLGKPVLAVAICRQNSLASIQKWIDDLEGYVVLNIAGPREGEHPGVYSKTEKIIKNLLRQFGQTAAMKPRS